MGTVAQGRGRRLLRALPPGARPPAERALSFLWDLKDKMADDDLGTYAAALAFAGFLSLFPILLLALSVAGFVADWQDVIDRIIAAIPGLEEVVVESVNAIESNKVELGLVGLAGALWAASALANRSARGLGAVFGSDEAMLVVRARAIGATIALGFLLLWSVALLEMLNSAPLVGDWPLVGTLVSRVALVLLQVGFFTATYAILTPAPLPWRAHVPGAVVTAALLFLLIQIGSLYVNSLIARSTAIYGTIGAVFGVLVFMRLAAAAFLIGAEWSAVWDARRTSRQEGTADTSG